MKWGQVPVIPWWGLRGGRAPVFPLPELPPTLSNHSLGGTQTPHRPRAPRSHRGPSHANLKVPSGGRGGEETQGLSRSKEQVCKSG